MPFVRVILSIDALHLPLTGIGWYTLELAQGLASLPSIESLVFTDGRRYPLALPDFVTRRSALDKLSVPPIRSRHKLLRPIYGVAGALLARRCRAQLERLGDHVCHAPNYILPRYSPQHLNVATIHDLSIFRYPELHPEERVRYMTKRMPESMARCERLVVSSNAVAHEVNETFGVELERIDVVPLGVRSVFCQATPRKRDTELLSRVGVEPEGYLLFVNGSDPRKDLSSALRAFRIYKQQRRSKLTLVVTAPGQAIASLTAALATEKDVKLLPYPEEEVLAALYRGTVGLLFPSLYEGFGLPVIEVLASGRPVLISQADTLLEFAHLPGVVCADTKDGQEFCSGIDELRRAEVSRAARDSAGEIWRQFSWRRCVERTAKSYSLLL